jgi:cell division protein FtsL
MAAEKEELSSKSRVKEKELLELKQENKALSDKLHQVSKEKSEYLNEITELTSELSLLKTAKEQAEHDRADQ